MNLQLSIAMAANPRSWPIFDGRVKPKGIDLLPSMVLPSELFWRQLKFAEFDISEMSNSANFSCRQNSSEGSTMLGRRSMPLGFTRPSKIGQVRGFAAMARLSWRFMGGLSQD